MKPNTKSMTQRKAAEYEIKARFECLGDSLTDEVVACFLAAKPWRLATVASLLPVVPQVCRSRWSVAACRNANRLIRVWRQFWNLIAVDVLVVVGRN